MNVTILAFLTTYCCASDGARRRTVIKLEISEFSELDWRLGLISQGQGGCYENFYKLVRNA